MGVKGSKSYHHPYAMNGAEYANEYLAYSANPAYQMQQPMHQPFEQLNSIQQKISPVQSSSRIVSNIEPSNYVDNEKTKLNTVSTRRKTASPETTYKSNQISKSSLLQELLECPICMNLYDTPTVLPCQHTFCKRCIVSLRNSDQPGNIASTIVCPICRESHVLPNGIDALTSNYTMKRLIELESMPEKEKKKEKPVKEAKCFVCQKYCPLKVCSDCSYMLCKECIQDPNHDIIIESKLHSKSSKVSSDRTRFATMVKSDSRFNKKMFDYSERLDVYADPKILVDDKLKLILLCHSASVEQIRSKKDLSETENSDSFKQPEIYEDEFGKCATYSKISISSNDRLITLKKIVEKKFGVGLEDQIIVYKDKILKNDLKILSSFQMRQYSRVHIFDERDLKENFNDNDDEVYGTYSNTNTMNNKSKRIAANEGRGRSSKSVSPDNAVSYSPVHTKKIYANEILSEKSRVIKPDRSIYMTSRPSNKVIYENNPDDSCKQNYNTINRRQTKYYSSNANNFRYANSNHYSNF